MNNKVLKFWNVKQILLDRLHTKASELDINGEVILINGFLDPQRLMEIKYSITIGGPSIPMIMLMEENTGRIHLFLLRIILPDYEKYYIDSKDNTESSNLVPPKDNNELD